MKPTFDNIYFEVLGVTHCSTEAEIKKAYREQMKKWHPDKFPNQPDRVTEAVERSKKINEAFAALKFYRAPDNGDKYSTSSKSTGSKPKNEKKYQSPPSRPSRLKINQIKVKSSNIDSIGYDKLSKTLQVEFLNGSVYQYYNVPEGVYYELMNASSKGKYMHSKDFASFEYGSILGD